MGLIIPVYVSSNTNATTSNAYVSLLNDSISLHIVNGFHPLMLQQISSHTSIVISRPTTATGLYDVFASLPVFASQDARNIKLTQVDTIDVLATVDLNSNIATALYDAVKDMYPAATDA